MRFYSNGLEGQQVKWHMHTALDWDWDWDWDGDRDWDGHNRKQ